MQIQTPAPPLDHEASKDGNHLFLSIPSAQGRGWQIRDAQETTGHGLGEETCGCLMRGGGSGRDQELGLIRHNLE